MTYTNNLLTLLKSESDVAAIKRAADAYREPWGSIQLSTIDKPPFVVNFELGSGAVDVFSIDTNGNCIFVTDPVRLKRVYSQVQYALQEVLEKKETTGLAMGWESEIKAVKDVNQLIKSTQEAQKKLEISETELALFLQNNIEQQFQILQQQRDMGWVFSGEFERDISLSVLKRDPTGTTEEKESEITISMILESVTRKVTTPTTSPLLLLDLGPGAGGFMHYINKAWAVNKPSRQLAVYGINAVKSLSTSYENEFKEQYFIGDLHNLNKILTEKKLSGEKFDVITSNWVFKHLFHPADVLEQAYGALKPGGVICINELTFRGCQPYLPHIIDNIRQQGVKVVVSLSDGPFCDNEIIHSIIIQKTTSVLKLPLEVSSISATFGRDNALYRMIDYHNVKTLTSEEQAQWDRKNLSINYKTLKEMGLSIPSGLQKQFLQCETTNSEKDNKLDEGSKKRLIFK